MIVSKTKLFQLLFTDELVNYLIKLLNSIKYYRERDPNKAKAINAKSSSLLKEPFCNDVNSALLDMYNNDIELVLNILTSILKPYMDYARKAQETSTTIPNHIKILLTFYGTCFHLMHIKVERKTP